MIPVTCAKTELDNQKAIVEKVDKEVCAKFGLKEITVYVRHDDRDPARSSPGGQDGRDRRVLFIRDQRPYSDEFRVQP